MSPTTLAHGHGEYVGSFSGTGNAGTFTHVASLPISFPAADSDLAGCLVELCCSGCDEPRHRDLDAQPDALRIPGSTCSV